MKKSYFSYFVIGLLVFNLSIILKPTKVLASEIPAVGYLQYNGSILTTSSYLYEGAGNKKIDFDFIFKDSFYNNKYLYVSIVLCSNSTFSGGVLGTGIYNLQYNSSAYTCSFPNSTSRGVIVSINFRILNGSDGIFISNLTTYQSRLSSLALIDFSVRDDQFVSIENYATSELIEQNSNLINKVNTLIVQQDELKAKLDDFISANNQTNSKLDETNKNLKETNDFLKDDTEPDVDVSSLATVSGMLPAGPVDSLLNIPFKFLSVISSSISGTCVPVQTSWVFDSNLTLPCFSEQFYNDVPTVLMNFLSLIPSAFILITYFKYLYKKVDRAVSMNSTADDEWGVI